MHSERRRRALLQGLELTLGIVMLFAIVRWFVPSVASLRDSVTFDVRGLAASLVASCIAMFVTARRWQLLGNALGNERVPYRAYFHALAMTRFWGLVSSTLVMDLFGRGVLLRAAGSRHALGVLMGPVVLERLLDIALPAALVAWAVATHAQVASVQIVSLIVLVITFSLVWIPLLAPAANLIVRAHTWVRRRWNRDLPVPAVVDISWRLAAATTAWSVMRYVAVVVQFWAAGVAWGVNLAPFDMLAASGVAQLSALVGITPGALGFQEAGWAGALTWLGHHGPAVAVFVLATRVVVSFNFGVQALVSWLDQRLRPLDRRWQRADRS